jgi:hypothetical protein
LIKRFITFKINIVTNRMGQLFKNQNNAQYPGGDEAVITLIFEGGQTGSSNLKITNLFRGKTENEFKFKITVE